jgi:ankyrin repeat protein
MRRAQGLEKIVKLLLERGANINSRDSGGYSALTAAAERNASIETVRLLVEVGADRKSKLSRENVLTTSACVITTARSQVNETRNR